MTTGFAHVMQTLAALLVLECVCQFNTHLKILLS